MLEKLGAAGMLGFLLVLAGIGLVAVQNLYIAAGIAFVVAGLGLVIYGLLTGLLSSLGLGGLA